MEKIPLVSICCTTYNHAEYIHDAILGFLKQKTNFTFEIIVHDDASTDGTAEIIKFYRDRYPDIFLCIFQKENQRSQGFRPLIDFVLPMARGKYIALCEGDDYWTDPYKLAKQIEFLEANPNYSFCFHQVEMRDGSGKFIQKFIGLPYTKVFQLKDLLVTNFIATCSVVYRRENLNVEEIPEEYFKMRIGWDWILHVLSAKKGDFVYLPDCMGVYRVHNKGMWSGLNHKQKGLLGAEIIVMLNRMTQLLYNQDAERGIKLRLREHSIGMEDLESQKGELSEETYEVCKKILLNLNSGEKSEKVGGKDKDGFSVQPSDGFSLSIVIPVESGGYRLRLCLESIKRNLAVGVDDVIVVGKKEHVEEAIKGVDRNLPFGLGWYFLAEGESLIGAINKICKESPFTNILFVHPKLALAESSLLPLKKMIQSGRADATTSKITNSSDNKLMEAGYSFLRGQRWMGYGEGFSKFHPRFNYVCEIHSGSRYSMAVSKKAWDFIKGFDTMYEQFSSALVDLGLRIASNNLKIIYHPRSEFLFLGKDEEIDLDEKRPRIFHPFTVNSERTFPCHVLVLGIYLADQINTIYDIVVRFKESRNYLVEQSWISLGGDPPNKEVERVTVRSIYEKKGKFELLNELLLDLDLSRYEYIIVCDDDVILPLGFLDEFLYIQSKCEFALAQPARTINSFIDHPIVGQHRGVIARQTMFVEIGPIFSVHKSIYDIVFPFDLTSPMGWGYENYWALEILRRGLKMGIIDNTPVDHSIRKPVANYDWGETHKIRVSFLEKKPHLKYEDCFRVIKVFGMDGGF
ncbi:MAG: glycosyltransferase [Deltaproteobacteria bacterium]|nr:glycosyltransferase [Deltaproteobacteria bacterium]